MTNRSGSAAPRKDEATGLWGFVVDLPPGADGKRRQTRRRGFKSKKLAQEALDTLRVSVHQQAYVPPTRQTFRHYVDSDWLPALEGSLQPSTVSSYKRYLRIHVMPRIGHMPLQAIEPDTLSHLYRELASTRADGKPGGLSNRTVRYVAVIVGKVLRDAVRSGRLVVSPATRVDAPKRSTRPEMKTWTSAELEAFLRSEEGNRYQPVWLFMATTGVRRGEALGVRWSDVDLEASHVSIRQTITAVDHEILIAPRTKNDRARVVELDTFTVGALRSWRVEQARERLLMGESYADNGLVFCRPDGTPHHPERFGREFTRRVERLDLPRIRLHDLRHTWATLALQAGVPAKVVQERLGHSSIAVTLDLYTHVAPVMRTDAAEKVAGLIFGARP